MKKWSIWSFCFVLALTLGLGQVALANSYNGELDFTVTGSGGDPNGAITYQDGTYTIEGAGDYTVTMAGGKTSTNNSIAITASGVNLTLAGIKLTENGEITSTAQGSLTLLLDGDNEVYEISTQAALTIKNADNKAGRLHANVVDGDSNSGSVTFESGTFQGQVTCSSFYIEGGSLLLGTDSASPTLGDKALYCTAIALQGSPPEGVTVSSVTADLQGSSYTFKGSRTDEESMLYFYLPEGSRITSITATNGQTYVGLAVTEAPDSSGIPSFVFTLQNPTPVHPPDRVQGDGTGDTSSASGLTITQPGDYTVSLNSGYTSATAPIVVNAQGGTVNLALDGVTTRIPDATASAALLIHEDCTSQVDLTLSGSKATSLTGGNGCAGIQKDNGASSLLNIGQGASNGASLTAQGGTGGAGIGGGQGKTVGGIRVLAGVLTARGGAGAQGLGAGQGGSASDIQVLGGSLFADSDAVDNAVPVEITLDGAGAGVQVSKASLSLNGAGYDYGLDGVATVQGGLLRFYLPQGTVLADITASDIYYIDAQDYQTPQAGGSVTLYPPQYRVDGTTARSALQNDYRNGLEIVGGNHRVELAPGITTAKAPISIRNATVTLAGMKVDTSGRGLNDITLQLMPNEDGSAGSITLYAEGQVRMGTAVLVHNDTMNLNVILANGNSSFNVDKITGASVPRALSKDSIPEDFVLREFPNFNFTTGSGSGGGRFTMNVASSQSPFDLDLDNCAFSFGGLLLIRGQLTVDQHSIVTVNRDGCLLIPEGSTVQGGGRIRMQGALLGQVDVALYYQVAVSASGGRQVQAQGIENGYALSGSTVTLTAPEEDFTGWRISPAMDNVDTTQPTISFTVEHSYTVKAQYREAVTGVSFNKKAYEVEAGGAVQLGWALKPQDATNTQVTFTSSDPEIALPDEDGLVVGVSSGEATITITTADGGFTDTCLVEVVEPPVRILDVDKAAIRLNTSRKLKAPTGYQGTWSTGDETIAKIVKGNALKGAALGETTLSFTVTQVTSKSPSLVQGRALSVGETVSVPLAVRKKNQLVKSISFNGTIYLAPGAELTLSPTLKPKAALDRELTYRVSDARVARVEGDKLIAVSEGKARLTATAASFATKKVSVVVTSDLQKLVPETKKLTVRVGKYVECKLNTQPLGLAEGLEITWTSKDESIAQVSETGAVLGIKKGKTKIIATAGDKKATFQITVKKAG